MLDYIPIIFADASGETGSLTSLLEPNTETKIVKGIIQLFPNVEEIWLLDTFAIVGKAELIEKELFKEGENNKSEEEQKSTIKEKGVFLVPLANTTKKEVHRSSPLKEGEVPFSVVVETLTEEETEPVEKEVVKKIKTLISEERNIFPVTLEILFEILVNHVVVFSEFAEVEVALQKLKFPNATIGIKETISDTSKFETKAKFEGEVVPFEGTEALGEVEGAEKWKASTAKVGELAGFRWKGAGAIADPCMNVAFEKVEAREENQIQIWLCQVQEGGGFVKGYCLKMIEETPFLNLWTIRLERWNHQKIAPLGTFGPHGERLYPSGTVFSELKETLRNLKLIQFRASKFGKIFPKAAFLEYRITAEKGEFSTAIEIQNIKAAEGGIDPSLGEGDTGMTARFATVIAKKIEAGKAVYTEKEEVGTGSGSHPLVLYLNPNNPIPIEQGDNITFQITATCNAPINMLLEGEIEGNILYEGKRKRSK